MPLNESKIPVRSNLTKQQQREAMAAISGYKEPSVMAKSILDNLTADQIKELTEALADRQKKVGSTTFDLNNPPKQNYIHQAYPKMIYHHGRRVHKIVQDESELTAHLKAGWDTKPFLPEGHEQAEVMPAGDADSDRTDAKGISIDVEPDVSIDGEAEAPEVIELKRGRGRPRKEEQE
jgi:hypothetical protein